jgi:hypothetical protein
MRDRGSTPAWSQSRACSWGFGPEFLGLAVADRTLRVHDPHAAFAVGWSSTTNDAGATAFDSRGYGTSDDGADWTQTATPLDPSLLIETVEVARSDPARLYVSGVRGWRWSTLVVAPWPHFVDPKAAAFAPPAGLRSRRAD